MPAYSFKADTFGGGLFGGRQPRQGEGADEERASKKRRWDSDQASNDEDGTPGFHPNLSSPNGSRFYQETLQRDVEYYNEDPNAGVVVKVETTLFKMHLSVLNCCPTVADMADSFLKKHGSFSDQNPLRLTKPIAQEWRAFMWALYSTAEDLTSPQNRDLQWVERLLLIISLTSKYDIPEMKKWVITALGSTIQNEVFISSSSSSTLRQILDVCVQHHLPDIAFGLEEKWCRRLKSTKEGSVPAIQAAEKYRLSRLKGIAYYVNLQSMTDHLSYRDHSKSSGDGSSSSTSTDESAPPLPTGLEIDPKLNVEQSMRLLKGYASLVTRWERLRLEPLKLPTNPACSDELHTKCISVWQRRWTAAAGWKRILGYSSADILNLLKCLRSQLENDDELKEGMAVECRAAALLTIQQLEWKTQESLAEHFSL